MGISDHDSGHHLVVCHGCTGSGKRYRHADDAPAVKLPERTVVAVMGDLEYSDPGYLNRCCYCRTYCVFSCAEHNTQPLCGTTYSAFYYCGVPVNQLADLGTFARRYSWAWRACWYSCNCVAFDRICRQALIRNDRRN